MGAILSHNIFMPWREQRREPRYSVSEPVVVSALPAAQNHHHRATVLDISKTGYRVLLGLKFAEGTEVLTTLNSVAIFGIVRHCELATNDCYTMGVQITKVISAAESQWESAKVQPGNAVHAETLAPACLAAEAC